jgi:diguanylate cyclase (GGDEF)-like protein
MKSFLNRNLIKSKLLLSKLEAEYKSLCLECSKVKEDNAFLGDKVAETVALYNLSRDISKVLDENKIFNIFKERINNYVSVTDCKFLGGEADLKKYEGYSNFPLIVNNDVAGYLVASGINENDKLRFQILAQQFLIVMKKAFLYKRVAELAIMDGLTQVFSRRHFLERFREEMKRSKKFKHSFSFLMVDIDKFKDFNDKYGHLVGDAVLRETAKAIKDTIRQIDFVGRYGGEELSIVLAETDKEQAVLAAERIRQAIESRKVKVYDEELKVTISVGISTFPDDAVEASLIIEAADKALYLAKGTGRNKVCAYLR